jgi:hypothetical protein
MRIPPFARARRKITDLGSIIKRRLRGERVIWPDQAVRLVGYMAWPNSVTARRRWLAAHCSPIDQPAIKRLTGRLKIVQQHWARVADIVHMHNDLTHGKHQKARGGSSLGKAIYLVAGTAKSKGTRASKLWELWKSYKDVAHLVTAAVLISLEAQTRHRKAPYGLKLHQLQPYRVAMLLPELVISVAMSIEYYGRGYVSYGRCEPLLPPKSLWRVPSNINLTPLELPVRKISKTHLAALNARRAGNRGVKRRKTTPVFG